MYTLTSGVAPATRLQRDNCTAANMRIQGDNKKITPGDAPDISNIY